LKASFGPRITRSNQNSKFSWGKTPHLHTNTSEIAVIVHGTARAGIQSPTGWFEFDMQQGDCVFFPSGYPHWLRNTGTVPLIAYFNYVNEKPETIELATMPKFDGETGGK
jgi:oxalate decarboxylase/phosphoglucose isomerase-like protein (cupin superfamily)